MAAGHMWAETGAASVAVTKANWYVLVGRGRQAPQRKKSLQHGLKEL